MLDDKAEKILIIRLSAIGDVIHSLPTAYGIRQKYPNAQIDWLVEDKAFPLVNMNPYLDNAIILPRKKWKNDIKEKGIIHTLKEFWSFYKMMRKRNYDITLDLHGLFKSSFSSFLIKPELRMGPADGRELSQFFYQAKIELKEKKLHKVERSLELAKALGVDTELVNYGLKITPVIKSRVSRLFEIEKIDTNKKIIILNPFTTWESKNWFLERYFELADELIAEGYYVIFTGSNADREAIDKYEGNKEFYSNLAGKTDLQELAEIYNRADLYIGGDTGPTHLAAAIGLQVIALMGPTNPVTHGPYGEGHTVIQDNSLKCIRCWDKTCSRNMQCMKSISVAQVMRIAGKKLDEIKLEDGTNESN
ncbi:glycosyltransferase family 9 protein [Halanaerobium hydrogeniformans]|uniref:Glycosyl transferase family 9 n=1 Tax=Halanaerobium hydrogeniformans TaxID=656519 RepID=E4RJX5_HALHG|nr:glycosyltransferase family 9 protein [Halanaerobium hydrogeniformans]ADQ15545.1 glycosyl transferase family 9 [Halanaerobium hydrogeniformans]